MLPVRVGRVGWRERLVALRLERVAQRRCRRPGRPEPLSTRTATSAGRLHGRRRGGRSWSSSSPESVPAVRGGRGAVVGRRRAAVADRPARAVVDHLEQHDADDHRDRDQRRAARGGERHAASEADAFALSGSVRIARRPAGDVLESRMVGRLRSGDRSLPLRPYRVGQKTGGTLTFAVNADESRRSGSNR